MAKLNQIVRNRADIIVEIDGTDDAGEPMKVPVRVTYLPRLATIEFRGTYAEHMAVLIQAQAAAEAAVSRGEDPTPIMNNPAADEAAEAISRMTLGLLESWDLEDEADDGNGKVKSVPVPLPKTADEVKTFVAPEMLQAVMQAVMAVLRPNQKADETSVKDSSAT